MIIKRKKILKIEPYSKMIPLGNDVVVGVLNPNLEKLKRIGFSNSLESGESILPLPIGRASMFNAEGKWLVHKNQPMETAYRTVEWRWNEWHGKDTIERSDFRDVPYKRYPRTFVEPSAIELTLTTDAEGNQVVRTPVITDWKNNKTKVIHAVNLLLEIFGECIFYDGEMKHLITAPVKRLNWRLLPPGKRPFRDLKKELSSVLTIVKGGKRAFTEHRLEIINAYNPDFAAIGDGGFRGYVVLGFTKKNLYVLESLLYGNATYVFGEQWEKLSQMTKAEILNENLQKDRLIHHKAWDGEVAELFK